jgi:hypothetical protein
MKLSHLKWPAVIALLALAIIPSAGTSTATTPTSPAVDVDLANEYRLISKYADDLVAYDKQVAELNRRARIAHTDVDPLQTKSDDLKRRLNGVQGSVREVVRKLKAANEWDDLDTLPARFTDPGYRALFQESSFKQDLEEASNGLTSHAGEISTPLDELRRKLTSQHHARSVGTVSAAPSPFAFVSVKCSLLVLKGKIIIKLPSVNPSSQHARETWAACHPGQAYPF